MEAAEPLDKDTMLEALKIADHLDRVAARLKKLGSHVSEIESPSLEVLERFPMDIQFLDPGSRPFGPLRPVPIGLDLEEARDECSFCAARLNEILQKWWNDADE